MTTCLETDTLLTIGAALQWDVDGGLRHLEDCADCRARLAVLLAARTALMEARPVDDALAARFSAALQSAARAERARANAVGRWTAGLEALLAGTAGLVLLIANGTDIDGTAAALTFALGAALVFFGRRLRVDAFWRGEQRGAVS